MSSAPKSPVTLSHGVRQLKSIPVKTILNAYWKDFNLDVARIFEGLEEVKVYECQQTGYKFYYPYSLAGDGHFYEDLLKEKLRIRNAYYVPLRFEHEFATDNIAEGKSVLDIGCGEGYFLELLKDKTSHLFGLETYNLALESCRKKGITASMESISDHRKDERELYDVVTAFQVLEHVWDINGFISNALRVLKKGGQLFIAVPNNEPYYQQFNKYSTLNMPPHHMGLWNLKSFEKFADFFNLTIRNVKFEPPLTWKVNAYYRAKCWLDIKTGLGSHTLQEKIKIMSLLPIAVPLSIFQSKSGKIPGDSIAVEFVKN